MSFFQTLTTKLLYNSRKELAGHKKCTCKKTMAITLCLALPYSELNIA